MKCSKVPAPLLLSHDLHTAAPYLKSALFDGVYVDEIRIYLPQFQSGMEDLHSSGILTLLPLL